MKLNLPIALAIATLSFLPAVQADVQISGMFTDGAVLQRDRLIPVWGTAAVGEKVTVKLGNARVSTTSTDGTWMVKMPAMKAGGPYVLSVIGNNYVECKDILVGEVWICSGQSNMQMGLVSCLDAEKAMQASTDTELRLFQVPLAALDQPTKEVKSAWMRSSYHTAGSFSAVGYYFGRYLRQALKVPVGIINSSWGGTLVEAWTSKRVIDQELDLIKIDPSLAGQIPHVPSCLYNAMISPVIPYGIRGAIWYQGESNAGNGYNYRFEHANMIKNWREDWKQGDFPFLSVQLAPWYAQGDPVEPAECSWADTRESQLIVAKDVKNSGMAVITDVGDPVDIHPKDKQPVGERLAYIALNKTYGKKNVAWSGPVYKSMSVKGNQIVLKFDHIDGGLVSKGGKLTGFTIAGADKKFVWADATIEGKTVVVSSAAVSAPMAVRYGWRMYPILNLFNGKNLPASPFRTDDWKLVTQP